MIFRAASHVCSLGAFNFRLSETKMLNKREENLIDLKQDRESEWVSEVGASGKAIILLSNKQSNVIQIHRLDLKSHLFSLDSTNNLALHCPMICLETFISFFT